MSGFRGWLTGWRRIDAKDRTHIDLSIIVLSTIILTISILIIDELTSGLHGVGVGDA